MKGGRERQASGPSDPSTGLRPQPPATLTGEWLENLPKDSRLAEELKPESQTDTTWLLLSTHLRPQHCRHQASPGWDVGLTAVLCQGQTGHLCSQEVGRVGPKDSRLCVGSQEGQRRKRAVPGDSTALFTTNQSEAPLGAHACWHSAVQSPTAQMGFGILRPTIGSDLWGHGTQPQQSWDLNWVLHNSKGVRCPQAAEARRDLSRKREP